MSTTLVIVTDVAEDAREETEWRQIDRLQKELAAAGFDVKSFTGKLAEAPEASAYLWVTDSARIEQSKGDAQVRARLPRVIVIDEVDRDASRLAEAHGLLGVVDSGTYSEWMEQSEQSEPARAALAAKRSVAAKWKVAVFEVNSTRNYALLEWVPKSLPQLIFEYVRDA